jgi:hypothetical protein
MRILAWLTTLLAVLLGSAPPLFAASRVVIVEHYTNYN